ncbi:response regulator [Spirosoma validum]|uniref:Response regulator transcription factor n=1 Tax=Spirosoma validum TaxID=2771355 RepID=A0A927B677_9BACT|nr:response regulator transcription factor [Spirosoma validum]MBD2756134.1 response regulator transcription factor [Spirosoma validum]
MNFCIIDDHLLITQFIKRLLTKEYPESSFKTYLKAEALLAEKLDQWYPDVVICDVLLPGMNGLDMLTILKQQLPNTKTILLTSLIDIGMVKQAMRLGIDGYLTKDASEEELLEAIKTVLAGGRYVNASLKDKLVEHIFSDQATEFHLSTREKEVLQKICAGKTPKEIAYDMKLSLHTVQQYIKNMMRKFNIKRTTELVVFAIQKGLYNPALS